MAYALANPGAHGVHGHRTMHRNNEALDPARGVIGWTLIAALLFWLPLGLALTH